MMCRKALMAQRACYCVIYDWHTYVDDECSVVQQWIGVVPVTVVEEVLR